MDNYFGFREQVKNYYVEMALAESQEIARMANRSAAFWLKDAQVRFSFLHEIDCMIARHLAACRAATSQEGQRGAFVCLRGEKNALRKQYESLKLNSVVKAVYLEFTTDKNGVLTYVVKGIGLVAGATQLVAGTTTVLGTFGMGSAVGIVLVAHGANNIYENLYFLITSEEDPGPVRTFYRRISGKIGFGDYGGDLIYAGVDLSTSLRTLFGKVVVSSPLSLIPKSYGVDTGRLFRALDTDMVRGITKMGRFSLSIEVMGDSITISGVMK